MDFAGCEQRDGWKLHSLLICGMRFNGSPVCSKRLGRYPYTAKICFPALVPWQRRQISYWLIAGLTTVMPSATLTPLAPFCEGRSAVEANDAVFCGSVRLVAIYTGGVTILIQHSAFVLLVLIAAGGKGMTYLGEFLRIYSGSRGKRLSRHYDSSDSPAWQHPCLERTALPSPRGFLPPSRCGSNGKTSSRSGGAYRRGPRWLSSISDRPTGHGRWCSRQSDH